MKKVICLLLVLSLSMTWSVSAFAATSSKNLNGKTVVSVIDDIISTGKVSKFNLEDGEITQYTGENGDIVHITEFNDGSIRYEYYSCEAEKIYSFVDNSERDMGLAAVNATGEELDVFDVAEYREKNVTKIVLSDEEEKSIREIMEKDLSIEDCQEQIRSVGNKDIIISEKNGAKVATIDLQPNTRAAVKMVNPTRMDINEYQEEFSWVIEDSASVYHNILGRNIQSRVYSFADNFVQKEMTPTSVEVGLTILQAAVLCATESGLFLTILGWAGVGYSAAGITERFIFMDEQVYTYVAEKSGWTYDYISPTANGRRNGYAICYYNQTLGKITMGFDGTKERTNFHWVQTNPGIGDVYDLSNSYILNKAYQIYTSAVVANGIYDAGYDGRIL